MNHYTHIHAKILSSRIIINIIEILKTILIFKDMRDFLFEFTKK